MRFLETRELAYFVTVAEEQHIGRAAHRLGLAQPPLSRAIKKLEQRLGVPLLERLGRGVGLTAAGEVLLIEGRKVLAASEAAAERARRAGESTSRLVLAMKPGGDVGMLPDILELFARDRPEAAVDVMVCGVGEQVGLLATGIVDMALIHPPHDDPSEFDTELLHVEGQMAVLPKDHRFAARNLLHLADLEGETMPRWPGSTVSGPLVRDNAQLMQHIVLGQMIAVIAMSANDHLRHDLVTVPVVDAEPVSVLLAWPTDSRSSTLGSFVRAAAEVAAQRSVQRGDNEADQSQSEN